MFNTLNRAAEAAIPIEAHPKVVETKAQLGQLLGKAQSARDARDRLARERASLGSDATTVLLSLGRVEQKDIDDRAAHLDVEIEKAAARLANYETALRQLESDLRDVRAAAASEIKTAVIDQARGLLLLVDKAFADASRAAAQIETLRERHPNIDLPRGQNYVLRFVDGWRKEAREFGVAL